ncbi:hypothetical protein F0562_001397 [Nyssa sinensis]|uniref:non-specific serine/threonine protein kinase n=1 Tax=Nyssa sinensis TaxID=561372 RepID=A0A5J5C2J9_9ASTE|nr:hypothetical protein F0562_001397 [Nyssa sinensis]
MPFSTIAQSSNKVTLGSSLTASDTNSFWASPSGDFAFGFQKIVTADYLLAIWFNKIPEKTIIWSANRNNPVQQGSKIQLTADGRFVLSNPSGQQIWAANLTGSGVAYAAMLDTGNFVLATTDSATLWQSFDEPTDTILPTQVLNQDSRLISSFSDTNYSSGRFEFILQTDGNLDQSAVSTSQFYQRAIIEYDGVFRQYVYPKSGGKAMGWSTLSFTPPNICTSITQSTGSGACGFNSYCRLGDDQRPKCECPSGYIFIDPTDKLSSCKQNFVSQNCDKESKESELFGFEDMLNTDWPLSDYEYFQPVTEDWCREECLKDCFCAVAISRGGNCWKKKIPLSNGRIDPSIAQTYRNITLGSSLTARNDNSFWASPSGDFAFGFQQIGTGGFLLAIWFNKIPEKTIIWSANRDNLVQSGSIIQLTTDGRLVLNDNTGQQRWSAGVRVSYAAMLDTGNFVVASNDSAILWQSFDEPTDTILPTQRLNLGNRLVASFSNTNYSSGRFQFMLQNDGNLVLYTRKFPLDSLNSAYWSTDTVASGFRVIFNESGYIYLTARNGSVLAFVGSNAASTGQFYQRAILEYDGVFRQYVYRKSAGGPVQWSTLSFTPSDICMSISQSTGGGACGFNSYCRIQGNDQRPICLCPSGYISRDPNDGLGGCKPDFEPQNCDEESQETDLFGFEDMVNTDWPDSDYEYFEPVFEDWCRDACLRDCFCAVAIFRDGHCWKKKNPLSNGRIDSSVGGKALVKIRKQNSTGKPAAEGSKKKDQSTLIITGSVLLGSSVFLNFLLLLSTLLAMSYLNSRKTKMLQSYPVVPGMNLRSFTYKELEEATDGFKEELGRGAFAIVYKGVLKDENGNLVAVKKLDKIVREGEKEFTAEINAIGRTNHKNLVKLLGYCSEGENRLLVYEFMSNGSLASFLFRNSRPNWHERIEAACGTARGLYYLHEECSTQIIHCDIKPHNVLLDESFTARISDFGLAKLLKTDQTRTITAIRGTKGYVAPEWFKRKPVTVKVDVYSFGILLLELICCRRSVETDASSDNEIILSDWTYDCYKEGKLHLLLENDEEAIHDMKRFEKFVMIAIWCIQEDPLLRPTMKKVTQMLEGAVEVSVPPDPSSFIS